MEHRHPTGGCLCPAVLPPVHREDEDMATIRHRLGPFTGHVGPVRFTKGVAETADPDMVAYFAADSDTYDVEDTDAPQVPDHHQDADGESDEDTDTPED